MTHHWLLCLLVITLNACAAQGAQRFHMSANYLPGEQFMQLKLLGTVWLGKETVDRTRIAGLSGLAWDEDEALLYAISDKGALFHLQPVFSENLLTDVKVRAVWPLKNASGKPLRGRAADSEGILVLNAHNGRQGDSELVISFELTPRLERFNPAGQWQGSIQLPEPLQSSRSYRGPNRALESVTAHPDYGFITTPELPLSQDDPRWITLYATSGKQWRVPRSPGNHNAVVALETLTDGSILLLERSYESILKPVIITLRRTWLEPACEQARNTACLTSPVAAFNSAEGWHIDNFEGLTRYRGDRFFIISDNNNLWIQKTLLSQLELIE